MRQISFRALLRKILNALKIDFVIAQGFWVNNSGWNYTKWASGKLECWYVGSTGSYTCGTQRGNMYAGGWLGYAFPVAFDGSYSIVASVTLTTDAYVVLAQISQPQSGSCRVRVVAGSSVPQNAYEMHIYAVGKWGGFCVELKTWLSRLLEGRWKYVAEGAHYQTSSVRGIAVIKNISYWGCVLSRRSSCNDRNERRLLYNRCESDGACWSVHHHCIFEFSIQLHDGNKACKCIQHNECDFAFHNIGVWSILAVTQYNLAYYSYCRNAICLQSISERIFKRLQHEHNSYTTAITLGRGCAAW